MAKRTCSAEGCDRKHFGKGLCRTHYNAMAVRRRRDPQEWAVHRAEVAAAQVAAALALTLPEKPCSKCGERKPRAEFTTQPRCVDGLHSWCKACLRVLANANYDSARARETHRRKKVDPEYVAKRKAVYDRWRVEHPDRAKSAYERWRAANPARVRANHKAWAQANPERHTLIRRQGHTKRRARLQGQTVSTVDLAAVLARDGMVCHICTEPIESLADLHFDHVIPLAKGGPHAMDNISPAHAICNMRKGARIIA